MRHWLVFALITISISAIACNSTPLSPSQTDNFDPGTNNNQLAIDVIHNWSPYIMIHTPGGVENAYRDAVTALIRSGNLRGVRVEIDKGGMGLNNSYVRMFNSMGIEVLGLISNYYLFDQNIEQDIDQIFTAYPEIHYFQIGNEVTTILPKSGLTMSIEKYMAVLNRIYYYVQQRYPGRVVLLTQSTFGSGLYGPTELGKMINLGLTEMSPEKIIVAMNNYDPLNAGQYAGILNGPLRSYRVWITETGISDPNLHISYVKNNYPLLRNHLRAERIYWYALWAVDNGEDAEYSLIKNPFSYPGYWKSPLFKILTNTN